MLPDSYKKALLALQDQASAAIEMIDDKAASKAALADAQRRMAELDVECKKIVRAVMKNKNTNLTIPSMTEIQLIELLGF